MVTVSVTLPEMVPLTTKYRPPIPGTLKGSGNGTATHPWMPPVKPTDICIGVLKVRLALP